MTPTPNSDPIPGATARSHTIDVVENDVEGGFKNIRDFSRRNRKYTSKSNPEWEATHHPYQEYVGQLVAAGWTNLRELENYLRVGIPQQGLVVSVLDIAVNGTTKQSPDWYSCAELNEFMETTRRAEDSVRLYVAEYQGSPSPALIESLGSALMLDPRFFQWSIHSNGHFWVPSQRYKAPYMSLEFGVLSSTTPGQTDAERFKALIYIQPDTAGKGWTGVILFNSHTQKMMSTRILTNPPPFGCPVPPPTTQTPKSFRELYMTSLASLDLSHAVASPFYTVSPLIRLNCFCWTQVITAMREADQRVNGISDTSIGHVEQIKKSQSVVERGGSQGWSGNDEAVAREAQEDLLKDFNHLLEQTELLWQTRDKMSKIRSRNAEARWTGLTNAFTYVFAPVTIMTGVYGMNVSQISGSSSNPNIWQFFVAVAVFNGVVVVALSMSIWIQIQMKHGRKAGVKEVLGYCVGRVGSK